jgi:hypothetical protein
MSPHLPCVPEGVSQDQLAASLEALAALLCMLGISYQGVADPLGSLLHHVCKTTVYYNVQAARKRVEQLPQAWRNQHAGKVQVLGMDLTHVNCDGRERV